MHGHQEGQEGFHTEAAASLGGDQSRPLADPTNRIAKAFKWVAGRPEELLQREHGSEAFAQVLDTFRSSPPPLSTKRRRLLRPGSGF